MLILQQKMSYALYTTNKMKHGPIMHGHGLSNKMLSRLQLKKTKIRLYKLII